jgi:hypothetical protein
LSASCSTNKVSETPSDKNSGEIRELLNPTVTEFPPSKASDGPLVVTKLTAEKRLQSVKITNNKQGRIVIQRVVFDARQNGPVCESRLDSYYLTDLFSPNGSTVPSKIPNDLRSKQMKDALGQIDEPTANLEFGNSVQVAKRGKDCQDNILKVDVYGSGQKWSYSWIK